MLDIKSGKRVSCEGKLDLLDDGDAEVNTI